MSNAEPPQPPTASLLRIELQDVQPAVIRAALSEGEASGEPQRFDVDAFKRRMRVDDNADLLAGTALRQAVEAGLNSGSDVSADEVFDRLEAKYLAMTAPPEQT